MRAFVMAAGRGTRLAPLTDVVPKPALPVANEPVMGRLLRLLARHGMRDVAVNTSYLADVMQRVFGDGSAYGVSITWSVEDTMLGTAGGMKRLESFLRDGDEPVLVLSGDGLHDLDLSALVRQHTASGALASLALCPVDDPSQYGVAVLDANGFIQRFQEKPAPGTELSNLSNTGIYVLNPEIFDLLPPEGPYDFGSELFPRIVAEGKQRLFGVPIDVYWNDIGGLDAFRRGNLDVVEGRVVGAVGGAAGANNAAAAAAGDLDQARDGVLVHPTAELGAGVEFVAPCIVGANARIGANSRIAASVILPGTHVPDDSLVVAGVLGSSDGLGSWARELATDGVLHTT